MTDGAVRPAGPVRLAIVTPVFNEADGIDAYAEAVRRDILSLPDVEATILMVDDGSRDDSWRRIGALTEADPRFRGLRLSRNFGAHQALTAGFDHVGEDVDVVATLACDLQDPPDTIGRFLDSWRGGAEIVWGARRERGDSLPRVIASRVLFNLLRHYAMPKGSRFRTGSFLLMDKKVLDCMRAYREHNRTVFALVAWTGFEQAVVRYNRAARTTGRSGWSFARMLHAAYDVLIGFSPAPARLITYTGFGMAALSSLTLVYLLGVWLVRDIQPGWTGIMATLVVFFGVLFMMLGLMTEYLYRIFVETKNRPLYFVASRTPPHTP